VSRNAAKGRVTGFIGASKNLAVLVLYALPVQVLATVKPWHVGFHSWLYPALVSERSKGSLFPGKSLTYLLTMMNIGTRPLTISN
jgi:hypothetical protein